MEEKRCQPCDLVEVTKIPPCPNQCKQPQCKSYAPKEKIDLSEKFFMWIYGAPSVGKTSIADLACPKYQLYRVHTGELLKKEVATGSTRAKCIENIMSRGELVPNDMMLELMKHEIESHTENNYGFIVDGYPRDLRQGALFEKLIAPVNLFLFLDGDKNVITTRHINRAMNTNKRWPTEKRMDNCVAGKLQLKIFYDNHRAIIDQYPHKILRVLTNNKTIPEVAEECYKHIDHRIKVHEDNLAIVKANKARDTNCLIHKNY